MRPGTRQLRADVCLGAPPPLTRSRRRRRRRRRLRRRHPRRRPRRRRHHRHRRGHIASPIASDLAVLAVPCAWRAVLRLVLLAAVLNLGMQPDAVLDRGCTRAPGRRQARRGGEAEAGLFLRKQRDAILQGDLAMRSGGCIGGKRLLLRLLLCLRERRQGALLQ